MHDPLRSLWRQYGWRGLYFRILAKLVTEPYLEHWHDRDVGAWATQHGFVVERDEAAVPYRRIVLRRV